MSRFNIQTNKETVQRVEKNDINHSTKISPKLQRITSAGVFAQIQIRSAVGNSKTHSTAKNRPENSFYGIYTKKRCDDKK